MRDRELLTVDSALFVVKLSPDELRKFFVSL